ncbi:MAG: hypothetical protein JWN38_685 [Candidatus Saccharibacteria bacterium]|nr:hypothetical protein [Candidatus Saccharibacteria bacterium]
MISALTNFAAGCGGTADGSFLGFPYWYKYLDMQADGTGVCTPHITNLSDVWLILAAVIEIMLRVSMLVAIGFVVYGGISYMTSQGEPDKTGQARSTITNALIGLAIAIMSAAIVNFIAGRIN